MDKMIKQKLIEVQQNHGINILFACESGSRAWGFASHDSDYDVRFIYHYPKSAYLGIAEPKDQLTFPIDEHDIDLVGWDLKKYLQLVKKSNSTVFEWLQSPIVYQEYNQFASRLLAVCPEYFNPKVNIHHYLGIAHTALKTMTDQQIPIKKLFYVLRPLLAAKWCMQYGQIAPMTINALLPLLPESLQSTIEQLIVDKQSLCEKHLITLTDKLRQFINQTVLSCRQFNDTLPAQPMVTDQALNDFFIAELDYDN